MESEGKGDQREEKARERLGVPWPGDVSCKKPPALAKPSEPRWMTEVVEMEEGDPPCDGECCFCDGLIFAGTGSFLILGELFLCVPCAQDLFKRHYIEVEAQSGKALQNRAVTP